MAKYLLDTNVILRLSNRSDAQHGLAVDAVDNLLSRGNECFLAPQALIEFWVVSTRAVDVNGLGQTPVDTRAIIERLLEQFPIIGDSPLVFWTWLKLVTDNRIEGKRSHDMRILATVPESGIDCILTFNPRGFRGDFPISIVHPADLV